MHRKHPLLEDSIQDEAQLGVVAGLVGCKVSASWRCTCDLPVPCDLLAGDLPGADLFGEESSLSWVLTAAGMSSPGQVCHQLAAAVWSKGRQEIHSGLGVPSTSKINRQLWHTCEKQVHRFTLHTARSASSGLCCDQGK